MVGFSRLAESYEVSEGRSGEAGLTAIVFKIMSTIEFGSEKFPFIARKIYIYPNVG